MLTILPSDMDWLIYAGSNAYYQQEELEKVLREDNEHYSPVSEISINYSFTESFDDDLPF